MGGGEAGREAGVHSALLQRDGGHGRGAHAGGGWGQAEGFGACRQEEAVAAGGRRRGAGALDAERLKLSTDQSSCQSGAAGGISGSIASSTVLLRGLGT